MNYGPDSRKAAQGNVTIVFMAARDVKKHEKLFINIFSHLM
ncbi:hypothetical protein [Pseudomonas putida]|nr:hypothetical protein [Pseudomonas putida]